MKNRFTLLMMLMLSIFFISWEQSFAQADIPHGISYQAVAYNKEGKIIANSPIVITFSVYQSNMGGVIVWQETHSTITDEFGLFDLVIGNGISTGLGTAASFNKVDWSSGKMLIGVKADFGDGMQDMGITQMQSVPYAMVADTALRVPIPKLEDLYDANMRNLRVSQTIKWNGKQWIPGDSLLTSFIIIEGDAIVQRNVKILSDLYVTDSVTATAIKVKKADIDDLQLNNNAIIGNNLDVLQNVTIQQRLTVMNDITGNNDLYITDSITTTTIDGAKGDFDNLEVDNDAWIKHDLQVDNNTTIKKVLTNEDDIKALNDVYVTDSITATTIDAAKGDFDNLEIDVDAWVKRNLQVDNNTTIKKILTNEDDIKALNDIYVTDSITATTIDAAKGDFDNLEIDVDAWVKRNLLVDNNTTIKKILTNEDDIKAMNDVYVTDSITAATIDATKGDFDNLEIDNDAWIKHDLQVDNNTTIKKILTNEDDIKALNDVYVTDSITAATIDATKGDFDNLEIDQDAWVKNNLQVDNNVTIKKILTNEDDIKALNDIYVTDSITAATIDATKGDFDNLEIDQDAWVKNNLQVDNNTTIKKILTNEDDIFAKNDVYVTDTMKALTIDATNGRIQDLYVTNDQVIERDLTVKRNLTVNNNTTIQNDLLVTGDQTVVGDITAGGNLNLTNSLSTAEVTSNYAEFDTLNVTVKADIKDLYISNNQVIDKNLNVTEKITSGNDIYALNDVYVTDSVTATTIKTAKADFDNVIVNNNQTVQNKLRVNNDVYVTDSVTSNAFKSNYQDIGTSVIRQNQTVQGKLNVSNDIYATDSIISNVVQANDGRVINNLNVGGDVLVTSDATVNGYFKLNIGNSVNEITNTINVSGSSSSRLPTEQAVQVYVESVKSGLTSVTSGIITDLSGHRSIDDHPAINLTSGQHGTVYGDKAVIVNSSKNISGFNYLQTGEVKLNTGATINEFSTSTTLNGSNASDSRVPTEKAIKTYVDALSSSVGTNYIKRDGSSTLTGDWDAGDFYKITARQFISTTSVLAPFDVSGNTIKVSDLNADMVDDKSASAFVWRDGTQSLSDDWDAGAHEIRAETFESDISTGTSPFVVASTTKVANLNADRLDDKSATDFIWKDGTQSLSDDWDAGSFEIRSETFRSDVTTGTSPFTIASQTKVTNLNADLLDDKHAADFLLVNDNNQELLQDWDAGSFEIRSETFRSDVATGTAPFTIASTTKVANLNVDKLDGKDTADFVLRDGLSSDWDAGSFEIRSRTFRSDVATGTAPFTITSTTKVANLNVDQLDGKDTADFVLRAGLSSNWDAGNYIIRAKTFRADVPDGTAPFKVSSLTKVDSLNADLLDGYNSTAFLRADGASIDAANKKIINLGYPAGNADATSKRYVDSLIGLQWIKTTKGAYFYDTTSKIGIKTTLPKANLHVNGSFVLTGSSATSDTVLIAGDGQRFMWIPAKKAVRSGQISSSNAWNYANIGINSVAMGLNTLASGDQSVAFGDNAKATGDRSFAIGSAQAVEEFCFASGASTTIAGATGGGGKLYAFAHGNTAIASGTASIAFGESVTASGDNSVAIGKSSTASSNNSYVIGRNLTSNQGDMFVIGYYNDPDTLNKTIFQVGNGKSSSSSNALTLLQSGNMTISGLLTHSSDIRLKDHIKPLSNVLATLENIQPVYYTFEDQELHPSGQQIGLIAQEVQKYYPELVSVDSKGFLSLSYSNFSAVLLQAIKEQQNLIKSQQEQLDDHEQKINDLEKRLEKLEQQMNNK